MASASIQQQSIEKQALDRALAELQATAANFAASCIQDSRVRAQYVQDIHAVSREFGDLIASGKMSAKEAAERVNVLRNQIMDLSRMRSSPTGRAYATRLKLKGKALEELMETYGKRLFGKSFSALSEGEQAAVYAEIVAAGGRADPGIVAMAESLGRIGKRLLLVSLAIAAYEIAAADDKPREIARQGLLAGTGIAGGYAVGAGAVATGVCAATAPVCVGVAALVGGILFAFGADLAFDSIYPKPVGR